MAATKTKNTTVRDRLPEEELSKFLSTETVLVPGLPYLWTMGFGWAKIGFYVKHLAPNRILVAHCNHFRNAGKDYGRIATEGMGPQCEWRYEGELVELTTIHVLETAPYHGTVNRGSVLRV